MEYPFTHLVSTRITRLLRPKINMSSLEHSLVPTIDENLTKESDEILCSNDLAENCTGYENMLIFPTKFG